MTDIVYILGRGSGWQDNELRYSLRSLSRFVSGIGEVYVVGHCPPWLTNVTHLPYPDRFPCKERNIMLKMAYACGHPDISENFLHIHDDHFALAQQEAGEIPFWAGGTLENMVPKVSKVNNWREAVLNTVLALRSRGYTTHNFDFHLPMLINKTAFPEVMDRYDWRTPRGYVVKSLYANSMGIQPTRIGDIKLSNHFTFPELVTRLKGRPWYSVGNGGLSANFKMLAEALYPEISLFEN